MSQHKYLVALAVVGTLLIAGAGTLSVIAYQHQMNLPVYLQSLNTPQISVDELADGKIKPIVLIDVRSLEEYQEDHIGDSQLVSLIEIEVGEGIAQVQAILKRYEKKHQVKPILVLYCTSGMRSIKANKLLSNNAYQVLTLTGGLNAWRKRVTRSQDLQILSTKSTK